MRNGSRIDASLPTVAFLIKSALVSIRSKNGHRIPISFSAVVSCDPPGTTENIVLPGLATEAFALHACIETADRSANI